jgi:hypothetical protein
MRNGRTGGIGSGRAVLLLLRGLGFCLRTLSFLFKLDLVVLALCWILLPLILCPRCACIRGGFGDLNASGSVAGRSHFDRGYNLKPLFYHQERELCALQVGLVVVPAKFRYSLWYGGSGAFANTATQGQCTSYFDADDACSSGFSKLHPGVPTHGSLESILKNPDEFISQHENVDYIHVTPPPGDRVRGGGEGGGAELRRGFSHAFSFVQPLN